MSGPETGKSTEPRSERAANPLEAVPFLRVSDMERSLQFYVDGLGFELVQQWTHEGTIRWCRLLRAGGSLMLQDFRQDDGSRWSPPGAVGVGVSIVFICKDALAIYQEARARGLEASKPFVGNGMWVTTLRDPDGYRLEFESETDTAEETEFAG